MNLNAHSPRRLSPINDDLESEFGAEVRDIPLYRNHEPRVSKETQKGKTSFDMSWQPPQTHELAALVTDLPPPSSNVPLRSRYA